MPRRIAAAAMPMNAPYPIPKANESSRNPVATTETKMVTATAASST